MATRKKRATERPFIEAQLEQLMMFSEHAQMVETSEPRKVSGQVKANLSSQVGLGLSQNAGAQQRLQINFQLSLTLQQVGADLPICTYSNEFRGTFEVIEFRGIDPEFISAEAAQTYISQVEWIARSRAVSTITMLGLRGVALPKPEKFRSNELRDA